MDNEVGEVMDDLGTALKRLLASEIAMYLKAQGHHWNVEGPMFHPFHAFFSEIYSDVYGAVDPTAENIRKIGQYAPFMLPTLDKLRDVEDKKVSTDPLEMCADLLEANDTVLEAIAMAAEAAEEADEEGILNFLAERDDMHKKWRWQLKATVKG